MAINSSSFANVCLPLTVDSRVCNECSEIYAGTAVPVASLKWTGEVWQWKWHSWHSWHSGKWLQLSCDSGHLSWPKASQKHVQAQYTHACNCNGTHYSLYLFMPYHFFIILFYFILLHNIMHELCHVWLVSNHLNCFRLIKHEVLNQPVSHRITPACCSLQ